MIENISDMQQASYVITIDLKAYVPASQPYFHHTSGKWTLLLVCIRSITAISYAYNLSYTRYLAGI